MKLKILTWNISYGYGMHSEGTHGYRRMPKDHFESSLSSISELIRLEDPDIVLMQEVDFDSKRSYFIHELDHLARKSGLLYRDELISWNCAYVPYPGLNPLRQFGKVISGGGILSRYPLQMIQHDLLPKPKENPGIYNHFYLSRFLQMVKLRLGEAPESPRLTLMNLHLEAFSKDNRELHLVKLQDRLRDFNVDIAGGDFNGSIHLFPETLAHWQELPASEPTFPSVNPTERLDGFIIKKSRILNSSVKTLDTGIVSDHFPLLLEFEVEG